MSERGTLHQIISRFLNTVYDSMWTILGYIGLPELSNNNDPHLPIKPQPRRRRKPQRGRFGTSRPDLGLQFRSDDIIVATYPRSGTTWTIEIIWQLHKLHLSEFSINSIDRTGLFLKPRPKYQPHKFDTDPGPRIFKTHDYYSDLFYLTEVNPCKVLVVLRDPKDVLCSQNARSNILLNDHVPKFLNNNRSPPGSGNYWDFVEEYIDNAQRFDILYIKYEDLKHKTGATIRKINEFNGYGPLSDTEVEDVIEKTSYAKMKKTHAPLQNTETKGITGAFKLLLSEEQIAEINTKTAEMLSRIDDRGLGLDSYVK